MQSAESRSAMYNSPDQPSPSHRTAPPLYVAENPRPSYPPAAAVAQPATSTTASRARAAGIALLVASGVMLVAALTKAWFTAGSEGGVGLLGLEKCRGAICQSATWFDLERIPTQIPVFATTALIATLAAVAFLIHAGVVLLQNRPDAIKIKWVAQLLGLASFGMVAFVVSLSMGGWSRGLSVGWSTVAGIGGLVGASAVMAAIVRPLTETR